MLVKENSLDAFRAAIDDGAQMIEFDVRQNPLGPHGHPIIAHDIAHRKDLPTIVDILDLFNARCSVNIEIKEPRIWAQVMELVSWYVTYDGWKWEQFVVSTFHHPTAILIKKSFPDLRVGVIMDAIPTLPYVTQLRKLGISSMHIETMNISMDMQNKSAFMRHAKKLGMQIWVWTVNDTSTATHAFAWGAERIFTDNPGIFH